MRNGILFNPNKLVMVSGNDQLNDAPTADVSGSDSRASYNLTEAHKDDAARAHTTLLIFMAVSIACTTAAVATGSYAVWLSRHQAARQALVDVNDILKSCQIRMQQLEADVQRLPERQA